MTNDFIPYHDDDLLPVSALQHLVFCERQAALIYLEGLWRDNPLTLEGSYLHRRVDDGLPRKEVRGDVVIIRGLALHSRRLGLVGRSDVVEFHRYEGPVDSAMTDGSPARAVALTGLNGYWTPFPIDYKRGRPKANSCDEVQLCAQALCLEEMLDVLVPEGALFYGRRKRRHRVLFDEDLRIETEQRAGQLRRLLESGNTPRAGKTSKCGNCSLINECLPESMGRGKSARRYLDEMTRDVRTDDETGIP